MANVNKYFNILEILNFNYKNFDLCVIKSNVNLIKKYLKIDLSKFLNLPATKNEEFDIEWSYFCLLTHILLTIKSEIDFNSSAREDLISVRNLDDFTNGAIEASKYGIRCNLIPEMQNHKIFENIKNSKSCDYLRLQSGLNFVDQIFKIDIINSSNSINSVKLDAMAAAICLLTAEFIDDTNKRKCNDLLNFLWNSSSKINYLRNLLILKSIHQIPVNMQSFLHKNLLAKLQDIRGFSILLEAMLPPNQLDVPNWKIYDIISNIIAHKGHSKYFYYNLTTQIFEFIQNCAKNDQRKNLIPAGVLTLRKLYLLNNDLRNNISDKIENIFKNLIQPDDVMTGVIVMDDEEIKLLVNILSNIFCGSAMQSLPSEILTNYIPILMELYSKFPINTHIKEKFKILVVQCLSNREQQELKEIISNLIQRKKLKNLHNRIFLKYNEKFETYCFQICPIDLIENSEISVILTEILKSSNNNILIYNSFIGFLNLLEDENLSSDNKHTIDLLEDEKELDEFLKFRFQLRFSIINSLTDLISFKQFHSQFQENPKEILDFIKISINKRIKTDSRNESDENISLILSLFQEILENSKKVDEFKSFVNILQSLHKKSTNALIQNQLENLIYLIDNGGSKRKDMFEECQYNLARSLIEESQPHLKVYGISIMIKLIKIKDDTALRNRHAVLALALNTLKDEESFTFLNCIKLFVTLINVMEEEVLEILSDEYLNDSEKIDYKLKIGETLLKITEDLGGLSYKYKNILINCFLNGCRNDINEFRCSSLSNLATICRLLTYQVHNFFQELLQLIASILETEKYLPAKRAAILVISQLLYGIDNLVDFEEFLLPIYRLLKLIIEKEEDHIIRVHATNGLTSLSEKCKRFLLPEMNMEKQIQIFGIKNNLNNKSSKKNEHILELN